MSDEKSAALVANAEAAKAPVLPVPDVAAKPAEDPHAGCVKRELSMRDRNLILSAIEQYAADKSRNDHKGMRKLEKVKKLLATEVSEDYFDEIDDVHQAKLVAWLKEKNLWAEGKSEHNPGKRPEREDLDLKGPMSTFWIPAKLDGWVQDALRACQWNPKLSRDAVDLCDRYGIKDEE